MKLKRKTKALVMGIALMSFAFGGCTKYANETDLAALETQKQAAISAEQKVETLKREKSDLESQVSQKERELSDAQNVLNAVKR